MTPVPAADALLTWMWQVILHSFVCGAAFYAWTRRLELPSGRTRRRLLAVSLALPLFTALVPGRGGMEFRASTAWFDGGRVLALPVFANIDVGDLVVGLALLTMLATVWQELLPAMRFRRRLDGDVPESLVTRARSLCGWEACRVSVVQTDEILIATDGVPWSPRAIFSSGALSTLRPDELEAVLRHEHAHWRRGRWWVVHVLFLVRVVQVFNPVALWCFREYCLEVEIHCDADAVAAGGRRPLARALLAAYETTDPGDRSVGSLRKRVDLLLNRRPYDTRKLSFVTEALAVAALALTLPWLV